MEKKKDKIKRSGPYQDPGRGGIRMTDTKLIKSDNSNWCTIPYHFFERMGGANFLIRCNYDTKDFNDLPAFCKKILDNYNDLKNLYDYYQKQDIILAGWPFWCPRNVDFSAYNRAQDNQLSKIRLAFYFVERNYSTTKKYLLAENNFLGVIGSRGVLFLLRTY